eukprot:6054697-Amphidinium_carterae.1
MDLLPVQIVSCDGHKKTSPPPPPRNAPTAKMAQFAQITCSRSRSPTIDSSSFQEKLVALCSPTCGSSSSPSTS